MSFSAISALLQQGARADLIKMKEVQKPSLVDALCERLPSSVRTEYLPFLGESPQLTKHDLGDMTTLDQLSDVQYSVDNESYRASLGFRNEDLEDDLVGGIQLRIRQMLRVGMQLEEKLLIDAITGSQNGFDGTTFFSDSHTSSYSSGATISHDNLLSGSGVASGNIATDFGTGLSTIMNYTGGNGEPWNEGNLQEIHCLFPWAVRKVAYEDLVGTMGVDSVAQVEDLNIKLHFSARLSDANDWYMFVTGAQKPFYLFDRKPLNVEIVEDKIEKKTCAVIEKRMKIANGHYAHGVKFVNA